MSLRAVPTTITAAKRFVARHHRHLPAPQGALFAVAVASDAGVVGVAIVGRPVARKTDASQVAEITRIATDGTANAVSFLVGRCRRICEQMGYRKLVTFTLPSEGGASMRASNFEEKGTGHRRQKQAWGKYREGRTLRLFEPEAATEPKTKWEMDLT